MIPVNWQYLIHIAKGCATDEEQQQINEWIKAAPEAHQQILDHVIDIYKDNDAGRTILRERVQERVEQQLPDLFRNTPVVQAFVPAGRRRNISLIRRYAIAASIALVLLFIAGREHLVPHVPGIQKTAIAWKTINTAYGQEASVTLPDGSTVRLSAGSQLSYPEQFTEKERQVRLKGAAFFDVRKDPQRPFTVQADKLYTKVLGTSFEVIAYANEPQSTVTLITGKVLVHKKGKENAWEEIAYLTPNKKLTLENKAETFTIDSISTKTSQDIQQGKLVFENSPFTEIVAGLNRRFNIHARFKAGCNPTKHISATFDQSMSLQDISLILSRVSGLHIVPDGDSMYISY